MKQDLGLKWYAIKVLDLESRRCHSSSSARKKEKENFNISPNQELTPFLVVEKDFARNSHILLGFHLYSFSGLLVWTLNVNS